MENEEIRQQLSQLVKRASSDEQLKLRLLNDPEPLLRENGVEIPEGTKPRVVVNKDSVSFEFVPQTELTESALGAVVGGFESTEHGAQTTQSTQHYLTITFTNCYVSHY